jgi:uncharacterized protein (TIGR02722 family)
MTHLESTKTISPNFLPRRITLSILALSMSLVAAACGPKAVRGGPGTENPDLDSAAMSTSLDRVDVQYLVDQNLGALYKSPFWTRDVMPAPGGQPIVAIWPIKNNTTEHIDDQMDQLLSSIETSFVNSGAVQVVSRERQSELAAEVGVQNTAAFDPATASRIGKQLGAKYYITGKLSALDERSNDARRLQYSLFLQVLEIETGAIKFQFESIRSKGIQ